MAVEHLVIMKIRDPLAESQLQGLYSDCESHIEKVPGVLSVSMGANFRSGGPSFTHALLIRFENRSALEKFMPHPEHLAAGNKMLPIFSEFVIIDYETERS